MFHHFLTDPYVIIDTSCFYCCFIVLLWLNWMSFSTRVNENSTTASHFGDVFQQRLTLFCFWVTQAYSSEVITNIHQDKAMCSFQTNLWPVTKWNFQIWCVVVSMYIAANWTPVYIVVQYYADIIEKFSYCRVHARLYELSTQFSWQRNESKALQCPCSAFDYRAYN